MVSLLTILGLAPQIVSHLDIPLLVEYDILYGGYALALIITQEIGPEDWAFLKELFQSKPSPHIS